MTFQREVTGANISMYELYEQMGQICIPVYERIKTIEMEQESHRFQVYEDRGNGFSEEQSRFVPNAYQDSQKISVKIAFDKDVQKVRLDPAMEPCVLCDLQICMNDEPIYMLSEENVSGQKNGYVTNNGVLLDGDLLVFATADPNLTVDFSGRELKERNILTMTAKVEQLSERTAECLCKVEKKGGRRLFFEK